jgi:hypothetical protein
MNLTGMPMNGRKRGTLCHRATPVGALSREESALFMPRQC